MDGVGTVGNISDVKYCPGATIDLILISKMGEIGFRVSFEDEEGPVVIRRKSDNAIECIGTKKMDFIGLPRSSLCIWHMLI